MSEEIREGIDRILFALEAGEISVFEAKQKLHSQGVVIKVGRELGDIVGEGEYHEGEQAERTWMLKVGYVAVEPLIKEGE